jgi:methylglutaconyl-CoA hydratase
MGYEDIRVEPGPVTKVVLARPQARNAMRARTLEEIRDAFLSLERVEGIRAVVVTGDGKDFCAGADIDWMRAGGRLSAEEGKKDAHKFADMLFAVSGCSVPVFVAAQGNVFGGGLGLLAACDAAFLADDAKLCFSEVRLGIMPAVISAWCSARLRPCPWVSPTNRSPPRNCLQK